jgi:hypothetical protein
MYSACPLKSGKEWKMLVAQVGDTLASLAYVANDHQIPDVRTVTEIKNAIGFKTEVTDFKNIAARLLKYNKLHGTSHYFEFTKAWGYTFKLEMKYNYLPVNVEKQRQRFVARGQKDYNVPGFVPSAFEYFYPGTQNIVEAERKIFSKQPVNRPMGRPISGNTGANEYIYNGVVYSSREDAEQAEREDSDSDYLIAAAETEVVNAEKIRKQKLYNSILQERANLKLADTVEQQKIILKRLETLRNIYDDSEGRVIRAQNIEAFEDILNTGNEQLGEIRNLLNNAAVSADDVYYAQRIINLWTKAGDFSTEPHEHIFLDEQEFNTPEIRSAFRVLSSEAEDLQREITSIKRDHTTKFVQQYTDGKLTQEDIFKAIKDTHKIGSEVFHAGRLGVPMLQAGFLAVERANIQAQQEASESWKTLDNLTAKVLKKTGNNYNIFKQVTEDGKESNRTVHRFSPEFFDTRNQLLKNAFWSKDSKGEIKRDKKQIKDFFDWVNKNTISFDPRILFADAGLDDGSMPSKFLYDKVTYTEAEKQKHISDLKFHLGEKGFEYYMSRVEKKLEKFRLRREAVYEETQMEENLSQDEKDALFEIWLREHSPYWGMDMIENPFSRQRGKDSYFEPKGVREYVEQVPRKTIDGIATKWYDKNFEKIEADEDLLAYHTYMIDTLNTLRYMLPEQKQALMGVGVLPSIEKSLMDVWNEKGLAMGIIPFWDKMKQLQTTTDVSTTVYNDVDPYTGDIKKDIQLQYIQDTNAKVSALVREMAIKYKQENGKPADNKQMQEFRKEARDILSKQQSWDLTKILKAYSLVVLSYKHKSAIEPELRLLNQEIQDLQEIETNNANEAQKDVNGKIISVKKGLPNIKAAWEFFFESQYLGINKRKVEGVSKTKLYTKAEQKKKEELEDLLSKETDDKNKEFLQSQIDSLGGFRTASGTADAVLQFNTLKGLGWNFGSAFSNIGFGGISNIIQGADGRDYSMKNLRKAYILTLNSVGRNLSADTLFNNPNGTATKIRSLMDKWDLLQTSNKELYDTSQKSSFNKLRRFGPYTLQERSEYVNQAPIMIAVMMDENFKAKSPDGTEVSLWEAYGPDGKLKEGYTTDVDEIKLIQKIKRIIEMNHGDYNNALKVKTTVMGRALTQFRTWMFEGFASRFESETNPDGSLNIDYALSYGLSEPYIRKGRYRSYTKGQLTTTGAALGTMVLPGVGTAIGAGIGYLGGKFFGMETKENAISDTLFTLKQLARKLMFKPTQFKDRFNATDAANMRKNMTELYIMMGLMGLALLLKGMVDDDDEKDSMTTNFLLNQTIRLRTDVGFYTNPLEAEKLTKTALPMASMVQDISELFSDISAHMNDEDDDVFQSGPFKGTPKWLIHGGELIPGPAQGIKLYRTSNTVFEK